MSEATLNLDVTSKHKTERESETCPWYQQGIRGSGVKVGPTPERRTCSTNIWTFHEECVDDWKTCIVRLERLA
jgi:hypothetical protein